MVGLDGQETSALTAAGKPVPPPIQLRGHLDTGSDLTAIAPWVLQQLGVTTKGTASTQTASGLIPVRLFHVSVAILQSIQQYQPNVMSSSVWATELAGADVLIGLSFLLQTKFIL